MSNIPAMSLPEELVVGRGDPVYMAHAYLTKVPVTAIIPLIEAFTAPGDIVVDPFAGSGMTGVAAASTGRRARLFDISVLGRHIGQNYVNLVDRELLRKHADGVAAAACEAIGAVYQVACAKCGSAAKLAKSVWSSLLKCSTCRTPVNYYEVLEAADWVKSRMECPACNASVSARLPRVAEAPVVDFIDCECSSRQLEQPATPFDGAVEAPGFPHVEIGSDRQMYQASALGRHGLTTVASFYSPRNRAALAALYRELGLVADEALREKLRFAFTASLTRASKRYQWSRKRPLNAANANYYVAPVFYEWNVFDLFLRKVEAAVRSDDWIRGALGVGTLFGSGLDVTYATGSADAIELQDESVDYVFTDPPFGSNLFYADMALFQEAWLDNFTAVEQEAVIDRGRRKNRDEGRYERLLTDALRECHRILKPGGRVSMVFGNSSGAVWALVQRAIASARLRIEPEHLVVLDKGQRSVKGLASGFEHVATLDLVITMSAENGPAQEVRNVEPAEILSVVDTLSMSSEGRSPSHLYLELLRHGLREHWALSDVDLRLVTDRLIQNGLMLDSATGQLRR